jgi:hypothetical protein
MNSEIWPWRLILLLNQISPMLLRATILHQVCCKIFGKRRTGVWDRKEPASLTPIHLPRLGAGTGGIASPTLENKSTAVLRRVPRGAAATRPLSLALRSD